MQENPVIPKSIVDKIYEGLVERLETDDRFNKNAVAVLEQLTKSGGLKSAEQVEGALLVEDLSK